MGHLVYPIYWAFLLDIAQTFVPCDRSTTSLRGRDGDHFWPDLHNTCVSNLAVYSHI